MINALRHLRLNHRLLIDFVREQEGDQRLTASKVKSLCLKLLLTLEYLRDQRLTASKVKSPNRTTHCYERNFVINALRHLRLNHTRWDRAILLTTPGDQRLTASKVKSQISFQYLIGIILVINALRHLRLNHGVYVAPKLEIGIVINALRHLRLNHTTYDRKARFISL